MAATIFDRLCDLVDDLGRLEHRMDHGAVQLALATMIDRFDALIDDTVGLERVLILDLDEEVLQVV